MHELVSDRILSVIPAYNEARTIATVIEGTLHHSEVLVVDDGSSDSTGLIAAKVGAGVVRHNVNRGKGAAIQTGFLWALDHGYQAVITLDADGQHDPDDIPLLVEAFTENVGDLVIGKRDWRASPFPRRYTNPFGSWLLSLAIGIPVPDSQSGFRLYNQLSMQTLDLSSPGFELETELIVQAAHEGLRVAWVPIRTIYGIGEISYFHPFHDSLGFLRTLWHAFRTSRSNA